MSEGAPRYEPGPLACHAPRRVAAPTQVELINRLDAVVARMRAQQYTGAGRRLRLDAITDAAALVVEIQRLENSRSD